MPVFSLVVQPLLQEYCVSCHDARKHKADLRLDSFQALMEGGIDGPVIKTHYADQSRLIECMLSAPDADGHMPPEGQPQPTAEEIAVLEWWVNSGAPSVGTVAELNPSSEVMRFLQARSGRSRSN